MNFKAYSLIFFLNVCFLANPSNCDIESFVFGGCSTLKYNPGTLYESNVNSVLTSFVNSAGTSSFNNFKISLPGSTKSDVVYGLYQCRGDLTTSDCRGCVAHAVSQLGTFCVDTSGGVMQLDGCFVKYDNTSFLGVQDKSVLMKKCGPSIEYDSNTLTSRDAVLTYLANEGQYFRVGGSGKVSGVAQCTQDLSASECQDCLSEATGQLRKECGPSPSGDMFLGKCYARYAERGYTPSTSGYPERHGDGDGDGDDKDDNGLQRTLAITIALIAGVALLVVFLSVMSKRCDRRCEDGK